MRSLRGQVDHVTVAHAAFGYNVISKLLHIGAASLKHGDFHAAFVIKVYVKRRLREVVALVKISGEALR